MMKNIFIFSLAVTFLSCNNSPKGHSKLETVDSHTEVKQFSKKLSWNASHFDINFHNDTLTIVPSGLALVNDKVEHPLKGVTITNAEVADLNGDGHAELLVYLVADGSGSYGDVIAYSVNNGKSMSQIYYTTEADALDIKQGYMGHDRFAVTAGVFTRTFPVYKDEDSNAKPTGGSRTVLYKLVDGETGRKLVVDKVAAVL